MPLCLPNHPDRQSFQSLPAQFDCAKYIETAKRLQIFESTADKQIVHVLTSGLITRQAHGSFIKTPTQENFFVQIFPYLKKLLYFCTKVVKSKDY